MIIRILDHDPPKPTNLSLFVTTETKDEKAYLKRLITDLLNYVESASGKKIKDREKLFTEETRTEEETDHHGLRKLPPQH